MTEMEVRKILEILHTDQIREISDGTVAVWYQVCHKAPFELAKQAAYEMLKNEKMFGAPSIEVYRGYVNRLHKAAKRAAKGLTPLDPAQLCAMNPDEREALLELEKQAQQIPQDRAIAMLGLLADAGVNGVIKRIE